MAIVNSAKNSIILEIANKLNMSISEINLYSKEFFLYIKDKNLFDEISSIISNIENSENFIDIKNFLFAPSVSLEQKINLLKIFTQNQDLLHIFSILGRKSMLKNLLPILKKILAIHSDEQNIKNVNVLSVVKMNDEQVNKISTLIHKEFSCKAIINNQIDKSIIGGFVIEIDNYLLDLSIKKQLQIAEKKLFPNI